MKLFGWNITLARQKATGQLASVDSRGGWWPTIRESYSGAWQQNIEIQVENVMTFAAVYACVTVPARDISKLRIKLVEERDGIWTETTSPSFSPVLRKPNHYQNRIKFLEHWIICKRAHGNAYILLDRDNRRVVKAMYVLDSTRVRPLVAPNGDVYYELKTDHLSQIQKDSVVVPASEIIHDTMNALYHPLVGISPITACGLAAVQGLRIQNNSAVFFGNGANPSGVLTAPMTIAQETADRLKLYWDTEFTGTGAGKVAVLGDGLHYEQMSMSAVDAQLIDQLKWTAENACTAFHMPPYKIGIGKPPNYNNIEALNQQYYAETLQTDIESIELLLDEGLGLTDNGQNYGIELDLDGLWRMDTASRVKAASDALKSGMTVNEVRRRFYDLGKVEGGDTVYLQQQNFSIEALAKRDASADPFGTDTPAPPEPPKPEDDDAADDDEAKAALTMMSVRARLISQMASLSTDYAQVRGNASDAA